MNKLVIDVGGSALKYAVLTDDYEITERGRVINTFKDREEFITAVKKIYCQFAKDVDGVAMSYCGELDSDTGEIHCPGSYVFFETFNLKEALEKELGVTVWIEKDATCAGLAEVHMGALKPYQDALCLTLGSGLGCAIILGRDIRRGAHDLGGLTMVQPIQGAFMRKVMTDRLIRIWNAKVRRQKEPEGLDGVKFFKKVEAGNPLAVHRMKKFLGALALFIREMQSMLDVEAVAIGGGVSAQPRLMEEIQKAVDQVWDNSLIKVTHLVKPKIVPCKYKNEANLIGALLFYRKKEGAKGNL